MKRPGLRKVLAVCAVFAAALAAWLFLAPQSIGGPLAYFVVEGTSMEPGLSRGDLVVARAADRYEAGDVVAYRSSVADKAFVHRIVGSAGGRFVLKGDANAHPDSTRPTGNEIYGKLWFALPGVGGALGWLAVPLHAALAGGVLVLLLFGSGGAAVHRRTRRRRASFPVESPRPVPRSWEQPGSPTFAGPWTVSALLATGLAVLVFVALGLVAYSRPTSADLVRRVPYRESGTFSYSAEAPAGVVYADGRVDTGEPVFLRLVNELQARFAYRLHADADVEAGGQISLVAVLSDPTGWSRTIDLQATSRFEGGYATATGTLDLRRLGKLIARVEQATGVAHESYVLAFAPEVDLSGRLAGVEIADRFAPRLRFRLDRLTFELDPAAGAAPSPFAPARTRFVERHVLRPGAISALGVGVPVTLVRRIALAGGGLALVVFLALACLRARSLRKGEPSRIAARYGHLLVPVSPAAPDALGHVVDVATMDGLARLAEPGNRPILHAERLGAHSYYVEDGGVVYRYATGGAQEAEPEDTNEAAARLRLLGRRG